MMQQLDNLGTFLPVMEARKTHICFDMDDVILISPIGMAIKHWWAPPSDHHQKETASTNNLKTQIISVGQDFSEINFALF